MKNPNFISKIGHFLALSAVSAIATLPLNSVTQAQTTGNQQVNVQVLGLLQLSPPANYTITLDPTLVGNYSEGIGNVNVRSNQKNGFLVRISSANGGVLTDGTYSLNYTLTALNSPTTVGTFSSNVPVPLNTATPANLYRSLAFASQQNCALVAGCDIGVQMNINATGTIPNNPLSPIVLTDTITYSVVAQ